MKKNLVTLIVFIFVCIVENVNKILAQTDTDKIADVAKYDSQVAGHTGMKVDEEGFIWKPFQNDTEVDFYETLSKTNDATLLKIKPFTPQYKGLVSNEADEKFLRMEDAVSKLGEKRCIIDLKMGANSAGPGASEETISRKLGKYAMRAEWGFVTPGFQYYDVRRENLLVFVKGNKRYGEVMKPDEGPTTLYNFVNGELGIESGLVEQIVKKLQQISQWFDTQTHYHFYNSSLLIAYSAENLSKKEDPDVRVKMIDFNHAIPFTDADRGKDENYGRALKKLIEVLQHLGPLHRNPELWKELTFKN